MREAAMRSGVLFRFGTCADNAECTPFAVGTGQAGFSALLASALAPHSLSLSLFFRFFPLLVMTMGRRDWGRGRNAKAVVECTGKQASKGGKVAGVDSDW